MPVEFKNTDLPDIIELKNVCQSYDGKTNVINNLNLLIEDKPKQGQFVVIMGLSGCGKSTLLRYICGLQKPTSGEVLIDGKKRTYDRKDGIDPINMVFQRYSSLPWKTVKENVELPLKLMNINKKERFDRVNNILNIVGLYDHKNKYAKYPVLSGGQLQRVAIARCLIANPRIILMDEPFGALDTVTRSSMQKLLFDIWDKIEATVVFVTHDTQEAVYLGDEIYIMNANPGEISFHAHVNLPLHRELEIKHTKEFSDILINVEDTLNNLKNIHK